jgi:hypothetical protein
MLKNLGRGTCELSSYLALASFLHILFPDEEKKEYRFFAIKGTSSRKKNIVNCFYIFGDILLSYILGDILFS